MESSLLAHNSNYYCEYLEHLKYLVSIPSCSFNTVGVYKVQKEIEHYLENLDFHISYYAHPKHELAPLLVANYEVGSPKTITFVVHADTVLEPNENFKIQTWDNSKLIGPGVSDDKGGIVVALQALRLFLNKTSPNFNIQLVSSPAEEIGSPDFQKILKILGQKSDYILGFEPALSCGSFIQSRNGNRWYDIDILGKEAHCGRTQGEELNAGMELAHHLIKISSINQNMEDGAIHVSHIHAGINKHNIVCGHAHFKLDTRFKTLEAQKRIHTQIHNSLTAPTLKNKNNESATIQYQIVDDCPPVPESPLQYDLIHNFKSILKKNENKNIQCKHSGGASDLNYMVHPNCIYIDGLGPVGGNLHTNSEYLEIQSLKTRSESVVELLNWIQKSNEGESK